MRKITKQIWKNKASLFDRAYYNLNQIRVYTTYYFQTFALDFTAL